MIDAGFFHASAIASHAAVTEHGSADFFSGCLFHFLQIHIPRSGIAGSIFKFLRSLHTVFQWVHQFTFPPTCFSFQLRLMVISIYYYYHSVSEKWQFSKYSLFVTYFILHENSSALQAVSQYGGSWGHRMQSETEGNVDCGSPKQLL